MTTAAAEAAQRRGLGARMWTAVVAGWAVVTGVAPHVLHHAGQLAGAALLAGLGGKAIFFALGIVLSLPMLRRLYRRFGSVAAPLVAVGAFAAVFALSSFVLAPRLTGSGDPPGGKPVPSDHASHHPKGVVP